MDKSRWGVHITHCCILHGCTYSDFNCPVASGEVKQKYPCESCQEDGIRGIPDPESPDYDLLRKDGFTLRDEVLRLRNAIRAHRDEDDQTLYSLLPEATKAQV